VYFAVEGGVPGAVAADNNRSVLVGKLVCGDIDDEFLQLQPCVLLTLAFSKNKEGAAAVVDLKIFRQQK
jgi:hypothetical protein